MDGILTLQGERTMLLGDEHELDEVNADPATVGRRAKTVRKQFSNGAVVG